MFNSDRVEQVVNDYLRASFLMDLSIAKAVESYWVGDPLDIVGRWVLLASAMLLLYVLDARRRAADAVEDAVDTAEDAVEDAG